LHRKTDIPSRMKRDIVRIDEDLCNGCGLCIPNCHEGALQIIEGKARLVSDLMCDGLGACLGHCPEGAITVENREAEAYNETEVMKLMIEKGQATVIAHLKHLKDHNETAFVQEGVAVLKEYGNHPGFNVQTIMSEVHSSGHQAAAVPSACPGSQAQLIKPAFAVGSAAPASAPATTQSELQQWPVQMHLINPNASFFKKCDLLFAADCVAFSMGGFHQEHLKGKMLAIACPKLDTGKESYLDKLIKLIDEAEINTMTVMIMEVPCCGGMIQLAKQAVAMATRKVPIKKMVISIKGELLSEEWV